MSTVVVKSVEINKGLSDNLFDPNKVEIKSPVDMQEMMKRMMQEQGADSPGD